MPIDYDFFTEYGYVASFLLNSCKSVCLCLCLKIQEEYLIRQKIQNMALLAELVVLAEMVVLAVVAVLLIN